MIDECFQALHWWHRRNISLTRFELLVVKFGLLDFTYSRALFFLPFSSWSVVPFRAFVLGNSVRELLRQHPTDQRQKFAETKKSKRTINTFAQSLTMLLEKNSSSGAKYGHSERHKMYYRAEEKCCKKLVKKKHGCCSSILARWNNDHDSVLVDRIKYSAIG